MKPIKLSLVNAIVVLSCEQVGINCAKIIDFWAGDSIECTSIPTSLKAGYSVIAGIVDIKLKLDSKSELSVLLRRILDYQAKTQDFSLIKEIVITVENSKNYYLVDVTLFKWEKNTKGIETYMLACSSLSAFIQDESISDDKMLLIDL